MPSSLKSMIYIYFFLCICILCTSVFAPARVYLVSMGYEGFQAKYRLFPINYIYKCFLRAITFYSTARRISLSFRYGRICFYDIFIYCFLFIFFIFLKYSLGKLQFFSWNISLSLSFAFIEKNGVGSI